MSLTDEHYLGNENTEKNKILSKSSRNQSPVRFTNK